MRTGRKQAFARWFSVAMVVMLLFSYGWTGLGKVHAKSKSDVSRSLHKTQVQSQNKIDKDLEKNFKQHDQVTFLLKFKDQVNTKKVAKSALSKKQKKNLTAAKAEVMKRSAIVSALRSKSLETQYNVKDFLKKEKKQGNVKNFHSYYIVNAMAVTATKQVAEKLAKMGEVEKVLPNRTRHLIQQPKKTASAIASATKKAKMKAEINDDDAIEPNIKHVGAPQAWEQGIDGTGTVIGSIDSGVQWDHPALKEKYRGYDPNHPDQPNNEMNWLDTVGGQDTPYDDVGHGTHTVGTMLGSEPDGSNQIGVAPGAQWIAVKAFSALGGTDADLLEAGEWMMAPKDADGNPHPEMAPDVINNSWGGGAGKDEFYREMVENWREAGIFPAFAAGNVDAGNAGGPGSVASPGNYPESFAVGATNNDDELADFSLQGPSPYDEIKPEIAAPGVNIRSSVPGSDYDGTYSGTSMATPIISGTVALLRQADASLSVDELENILMDTAKPLTDKDFPETPNNGYGHGGVQAGNAVASVLSGLGKIEGQVMKEGEDNEAPKYQHEAPDETYAGMDLPLTIDVTDNVSITKVELQYRSSSKDDWKTIEADRVNGDYKNATYQATIPGDHIAEPYIMYRWHISDYGKNDVTTDTNVVDVKPGITIGYTEDFESTPTGWTSYGENNSWEWGKPTSGPGEAYSGEKVYATNLDGNYDANANMTLMMPPIDLPEGESYLQFKQWYSFEQLGETPYDFGHVYISTDQENWTELMEMTDKSDGWTDGEADLSEFAGKRVYIAFNVTSDFSGNYEGWYLDDVALTDKPQEGTIKAHLPVVPKHKGSSLHDNSTQDQKAAAKKKGKKKPDPSKMKPGKPKNVQSPLTAAKKSSKNSRSTKGKLASLPLSATVSVLETDSYVRTNPADGSYSLMQPTGGYTLKAESYGFYSKTQTVEVNKDETSMANFTLEEIPKGTLEGTITDKQTGDPVKGATVSLAEDAAITPVETDENGHYSLKAYEGDYTMHVSAPNYYSKDVNVTVKGDDTTTQNVELKPFIGTPGEIGYDDGTAENAREFYDAGNGWAVRMSLPEGHDSAMVTGGKFKFWNDEFPTPGGDKFQVEIWDASGKDGAPGKKLAGPIDATAVRDETKWTQVDLKDQGVMVDGDFYMVYIQTKADPNAPGLATDEDPPNAKRSWQYVSGEWSPSPADEGNYMIRALVDYEVTPPEITSPEDGSYTNESSITVKGKSSPDVDITIFNNGEEAATTSTNDDGQFSADVTLSKGENELTATASTDAGTTDPSDSVTVTLDQDKPDLTVEGPKDRMKTNKMAVEVKGTATDENLDWVKVNGQKADLNDDGTYSKRILLDNGENEVKVVARDKANNRTRETRMVFAKFDAPEITNLKPSEDKYLNAGESVIIEMDSEPGLKATFAIRMPLANAHAAKTSSIDELPMMETSDGHYVGVWTATSNLKAEGAKVEVITRDDYGNKTEKVADGELYINSSDQGSDKPGKPDKERKNLHSDEPHHK